jgi:CBS domain-containing protein
VRAKHGGEILEVSVKQPAVAPLREEAGMVSHTVGDCMTPDPITVPTTETLRGAAARMAADNIGDVVVQDDGRVTGIVTDRDLVVRGLAEGLGADALVGEVASRNVAAVHPADDVGTAVRTMREAAVRRLPVVDGDRVVGVVSIGDLALEHDPNSALADISDAPPNR